MDRIRNWLRKWIGVEGLEKDLHGIELWRKEQTRLAVDVGYKEPHQVVVTSSLNGGQVHIINAQFDTLAELRDFVQFVKNRHGIEQRTTWDLGPHRAARQLLDI